MSVLGDDEEDDDTIEVNIGSNLEIEDISDDEAESKKPKSNLDKDIKRNYWRQKGLEL